MTLYALHRSLALAFGMPGIQEIVVIAILFLLLATPLIVVGIVLYIVKLKSQDKAAQSNLYPCPDCGKLISRLAESCPHCGRPARI